MNFILYSNFVYCDENRELVLKEKSYAVCENGISQGIFSEIPEEYSHFEVKNYANDLIMPALIDLHVHASQYEYRGTGMDCELLEWLEKYTFKAESRFADINYADEMYNYFVNDLKNSATSRAVIFATIDKDATLKLMEKLDETGLVTYVGKVNMDRNSPDFYIETTENSIKNTRDWVKSCDFKNTKPIITPRFTPTCSDELLSGLGEILRSEKLNIQSHLSENDGEILWVSELCKDSKFYGDTYEKHSLFGSHSKAIMAHCVSSGDEEIELMRKNGTFAVHCPSSNINIASGIAPIRKYLENGLNIGFGTDIAGGQSLSVFNEMVLAIGMSKMYWRYIDKNAKPLTVADVFYMATLGGGKFFGNVGSFEKGYLFDAIIIDDKKTQTSRVFSLRERFERAVYLWNECQIKHKYVNGCEIF